MCAVSKRLQRMSGDNMKTVIPTVFATSEKQFFLRFHRLTPITSAIQIDFMDGKLVPAQSFSLDVVPSLHLYLIAFEAHLMVANPEVWVGRCAVKGFSKAIVHVEALKSAAAGVLLIQNIKTLGMQPMIAINPETPMVRLKPFIKLVSGVLVMGVHPGKEHQSLAKNTALRIRTLKKQFPNLWVQVDGGVNAETIGVLAAAGVDAVNAGSFVAEAKRPKDALEMLEKLFRDARK